jgi:hypothetical protein
MELQAVLDAIATLDGPLDVVSDSTYVVNCFRDRWWEGWISRGWVNSQRKPVANRDLWEPLIAEVQRRKITFRWVKGHSGDRWNDVVDRLAVEAATSQRSRRGDRAPTTAGPPDETGSRAGTAGVREIGGHTLLVTGHRPPELGGYGETPTAAALRSRLKQIFLAKSELHPDLVVVTALGLGAEMLAAEAASEAPVPFVAVLAHPGIDDPWPDETKRRFSRLKGDASDVITLSSRPPESRQRAAASFARRDAWLRRNADEALVVWNGTDALVGKAYRSVVEVVGEDDVWLLDPSSLG